MWLWRKKNKAAKHGLEAEVSLSSGERDSGKMSPCMSVPRTEVQERATENYTDRRLPAKNKLLAVTVCLASAHSGLKEYQLK